MRFVLFYITLLFCSGTILAESYQIFITKIKVSAKNNGKYWDTFKGAPDIQVIISKKHNDQWKKVFVSKVFTNHHIVDEQVLISASLEENDEVIINVVDRDFRRNDNIGSQMLTVKESEKTINFSMVEELRYVITKHSSLEDKKKAIENKEWQELQKQKEASQQQKIDEREKWRAQLQKERKKFSDELQEQKQRMMEETQAEIATQKEHAKKVMEEQQQTFAAAWEKKRELHQKEMQKLHEKMREKIAKEEEQKQKQLTDLSGKVEKMSNEFANKSLLQKKKMELLKKKNEDWNEKNSTLKNKIEEQEKTLKTLQETINKHKKLLEELRLKVEKVQKQAMFQGPRPKKLNPQQMARAIRAIELLLSRAENTPSLDIESTKESVIFAIKSFTKKYKELEKVAKLYAQK
ncbi:hypothetical protein [Candidatus Uabimicrobium sp. HlEnr_7]|uniref:hypothetical protein n=1 Tax=Candidatus Uabimicrobium helgolandensis TaxID=3095367 RepID=UPI003556BB74